MKRFISILLSLVVLVTSMSAVQSYADDVDYTTMSTNGSWYEGYIDDQNKLDWYKIIVPSDGKITIKVMHYGTVEGYMYNYDYSSCVWNGAYILNGGYNSEGLSGGSTDSPVTSTITRVLSKGTYFISINKRGNYSDKYKLSVTYNSYNTNEIEPNDFENAMSVEQNNEIIGAFTCQDDLDWYKIYIPQKIEIAIKIQHYMTMEWYLYNYDLSNCIINGSRIVNGGYNNNGLRGGSETSPETNTFNVVLSKGDYYIKLQKCDVGKYKLSWKMNITVSKPNDFRVSSRNTTSLKLAWNKASGVSGYQLQRKSGNSYKTVANTTATSYTVSNLTSATAYTFRVRAYKTINGTKYYSGWKTLTAPTKPGTPSIKAPSTNKKHQIIAKWNTVARVSGYQVQYSKTKNFNSVIATKIVSGQSKTSYTGNNFTKGKTYYVRVRAYKTVNGAKYYGAWSSVKSIKCK